MAYKLERVEQTSEQWVAIDKKLFSAHSIMARSGSSHYLRPLKPQLEHLGFPGSLGSQ